MAEPYVFVLAGGSGTRLAPLSLTSPGKLPKQFLALVGRQTMLQQTIERVPAGQVVVVPEERYVSAIREQCRDLPRQVEILAEPFGCNTAAAVGLCARYAQWRTGDEQTVLFFLPADHLMDRAVFGELFVQAVERALTGRIVTIGITPDRPETGYGYIQTSAAEGRLAVRAFVEKPDLPTAQKYLAAGGYFWNAGMFVMQADTALRALERDAPEIYNALLGIDFAQDWLTEIARQYQIIKDKKQNISIDYAVMEKEAANLELLPAPTALEWNDVGGWIALKKYFPPDAQNNLLLNYTPDKIKLAGLREMLVVDTENGILLCPQAQAQRAKEIIAGLEKKLTAETIDCQGVSIENHTARYIGAIGLQNIKVVYDHGELNISSL
ncbi:mannose-1-phosphate guanylyltransferase [Candidatus Termititenax persephonae]|uniref:Mannose-1-phosphate guanylyltransferase n=1 Tax=Candidatus Termititenax persephonae TaxID=2218525 RepID=A0A388TFX8_9BACT|nr:mannose-1-phosphate guanylyltransferase [Candidatus Termititenax persephonae]